VVRWLRRGDDGGDITNVQYKSSWNCRYKSPLYNEYILIKNLKINNYELTRIIIPILQMNKLSLNYLPKPQLLSGRMRPVYSTGLAQMLYYRVERVCVAGEFIC
jgi:hypothetical protein